MKRLTIAALLFSTQQAFAGTNGLDSNFGSGGALLIGPTPQSGLVVSTIKAITLLPDGSILVGGRSASADPMHLTAGLASIGHLKSDGSWDTGFGDHGVFILPYGSVPAPVGGEIHHMVITSDGSLLTAGGAFSNSSSLGMHTCTLLIKLSATGALKADFAGAGATCFDFSPETIGTFNSHFEDISVESDDGFLLTTVSTNLGHGAVARLSSNGTPDTRFGDSGMISVPFASWLLARQADGNTLITGATGAVNVMRIRPNGMTDLQYGFNGVQTFDAHSGGIFPNPMSSRLDAQGRLIVSDVDPDGHDYIIGRLNISGNLDETFNGASQQPSPVGYASLPIATSLNDDGILDALPIADGHIFAIGYGTGTSNASDPYHLVIARLNADASFDVGFGDAAHPGWAQLTVGSFIGGTIARAVAADDSGHAFVSTNVTDDAGHSCPALLRFTADRVFDGAFEGRAALSCPN